MCGIAGLVVSDTEDLDCSIRSMVEALDHRGPDERGFEVLTQDGVALGMARLSILDIAGGHQPMWDEQRRYAVVFNGEIYNYAELRRELAGLGHRFSTDHSDTEVLVHGFEEWGHDLFLRLNGMFALAIWDRQLRRMVLARDRTGEKPLYIARLSNGYAVASEMKALLRNQGLARRIDHVALEQYLAFDFVIGPRTMLADVQKLPAAHYATIDETGLEMRPYWQMDFAPRPWDKDELLQELDETLDRSVAARMVADVPVGLFLSGGLDSTTVGYYMTRHSSRVDSFSIGFEEKAYDESDYARLAAQHLGTSHHLEVFSQERVRDLVPRIPEILDEPMGDQSIFPTYLLSLVTRRGVKVALGGDGSDELLMGYRAYQGLKASWMMSGLPGWVRATGAMATRAVPGHGRRAEQLRRLFSAEDARPSHRLLGRISSLHGSARALLSAEMRACLPDSPYDALDAAMSVLSETAFPGPAEETIAAYVRGYLQEDILVKVDRASMAASLEVRTPFLDPDVIELLNTVPAGMKMRGFRRKDLLRRLMRGRIPDAIIDRPKQGFGVPLNGWLRDSLKPLLREYLAPERLGRSGYLEPAEVQRLVDEHLGGLRDHGNALWLLLQFELWRERWIESAS